MNSLSPTDRAAAAVLENLFLRIVQNQADLKLDHDALRMHGFVLALRAFEDKLYGAGWRSEARGSDVD